ncbi:hypothetical protein CYMTET_14186 [Cymbomonas tetramitiformis]|uniref:Uncharacterized protein n=1 Tax=Cymbomonas tetramitiformis TaxID=36881 RepID=A0AAE0GI06_9CHLO|nr:hypothetical protein CYMTET_14186 [Cymbomonas tetramitiformis]
MNRELTACGFCRNDFQVVDTEAPFGASDIIKGHRPSQVPADIDLLKFVARVEGQRGTDPAKCPDPYAELQCCVNTKVKGGQTVYERSQGGALAGDWPPTLTWVGETVRFINLSFSQLQVAAVFLSTPYALLPATGIPTGADRYDRGTKVFLRARVYDPAWETVRSVPEDRGRVVVSAQILQGKR